MRGHHRLSGRTTEGSGELWRILDYAINPKLARGMWISTRLDAKGFGPLILAPDLSKPQEETLLRSVAVHLVFVYIAIFDTAQKGHVGEADARIISAVLAQRQSPIQMHAFYRAEV